MKTAKYVHAMALTVAAAIACLVVIDDQPWTTAMPLFVLALELIIRMLAPHLDSSGNKPDKEPGRKPDGEQSGSQQ